MRRPKEQSWTLIESLYLGLREARLVDSRVSSLSISFSGEAEDTENVFACVT